ncbi:TIGR02234 family membrane protein [Aldersonia sp. NBC_00410]|uniref:TIGR02234 family membrane protein n=1 Tax=Aldersonia sp. NBC_00410 TaxID=2975954 RepID=UPI00224EC881|nr:TIGR02234 family membrane protein [Aldersonia sp. NBC_00410]MCX5046065.1 TIGR02234 family membrane protein [Aldersonia sp. NBC_00410]
MTETKPDDAGRRLPVGALIALAVGAACLWASSRMTWVEVTSFDGLGEERTTELLGSTWFGALTPLALALVAAIAAVFALRGWLRRILGVIVALIGCAAMVPPVALLAGSGPTRDRAAALAELPGRAEVTAMQTYTLPAVLAVIGGALAFVAGVLLTRKPPAAPTLSAKYDAPAARRADATRQVAEADAAEPGAESGQLSERTLWDALDAGEDPTTGRDDGPANRG